MMREDNDQAYHKENDQKLYKMITPGNTFHQYHPGSAACRSKFWYMGGIQPISIISLGLYGTAAKYAGFFKSPDDLAGDHRNYHNDDLCLPAKK
jgi:hypothetical protein